MARRPRADSLILDIETIPDVERWQRPEPPAVPEGAPLPKLDAFPPIWAHRIIVIGCLVLDPDYRLKQFRVIPAPAGGTADERERNLLADLSRTVGRDRQLLVTYNGRGFDLPVIALRSLCHAVPQGWYYRDKDVRDRRSGDGHLDLCDWLADHGAIRANKLDHVTRLIGLPGKVGVDGSQVEGLYNEGKLAAIEQYCLADVAQTALLFMRFRLLQGAVSNATYRDRIGALVDALAADGRVSEVLDGLDRARLRGPEPDVDDVAS